MQLSIRLLCIAALLPTCSKTPADSHLAPFAHLVGHWSATQTVLGFDGSYTGAYDIRLRDDHILVHDFQSDFDGGFSGHEEMSYDSDLGKLVAQWSDSQSTEVARTEGSYDPTTSTLTMVGIGPDLTDPRKTTEYRHQTHYQNNQADYTMSVVNADGSATEVMWIHMVKNL